MAVGVEQVRQVAALAKLELTVDEQERLVDELNRILGYMEKLNELDTAKVEPTSHPVPMRPVLRDDRAAVSAARDGILAAAPQRDGDYFRVPRIIE